jgi:hypothetical protein
MKKNVGTTDAVIRILIGVAGLIWSATRTRGRFPWLIALLSGMKVAEGITRFCPVLALLGKSTARTGMFIVKQGNRYT